MIFPNRVWHCAWQCWDLQVNQPPCGLTVGHKSLPLATKLHPNSLYFSSRYFRPQQPPGFLRPPPQVSRKKGVAEAYLPPRIQYEAWTAPLPYWILGKVQEVQNTCANKQKKHLNLQKFDRGIGDFRCQSRTLVRGAQQSFDPKGFPEPKICLKLGGFPKNCLKTAWFWRNLGGKGGRAPRAPLDPLLDLSLPQLGGTVN